MMQSSVTLNFPHIKNRPPLRCRLSSKSLTTRYAALPCIVRFISFAAYRERRQIGDVVRHKLPIRRVNRHPILGFIASEAVAGSEHVGRVEDGEQEAVGAVLYAVPNHARRRRSRQQTKHRSSPLRPILARIRPRRFLPGSGALPRHGVIDDRAVDVEEPLDVGRTARGDRFVDDVAQDAADVGVLREADQRADGRRVAPSRAGRQQLGDDDAFEASVAVFADEAQCRECVEHGGH